MTTTTITITNPSITAKIHDANNVPSDTAYRVEGLVDMAEYDACMPAKKKDDGMPMIAAEVVHHLGSPTDPDSHHEKQWGQATEVLSRRRSCLVRNSHVDAFYTAYQAFDAPTTPEQHKAALAHLDAHITTEHGIALGIIIGECIYAGITHPITTISFLQSPTSLVIHDRRERGVGFMHTIVLSNPLQPILCTEDWSRKPSLDRIKAFYRRLSTPTTTKPYLTMTIIAQQIGSNTSAKKPW